MTDDDEALRRFHFWTEVTRVVVLFTCAALLWDGWIGPGVELVKGLVRGDGDGVGVIFIDDDPGASTIALDELEMDGYAIAPDAILELDAEIPEYGGSVTIESELCMGNKCVDAATFSRIVDAYGGGS